MRRRRILFTVLLVAAIAGCATSKDISDQATKGNIGIEGAHNQVLFLNTLRAYKNRPMYFTAISHMVGPLGMVTPSATLTLPFGSGAGANTFSPTFRPDTPAFTLQVLDTQKFLTGIMTPLKASTVKYYLDQGWPDMLILSLMVREIIYVEDGPEPPRHFVNYPDVKKVFTEFQKELTGMVACGFKLKDSSSLPNVGPNLNLPASTRLKDLVNVATEKLALAEVLVKDAAGNEVKTGQWFLAKPKGDIDVIFTKMCSEDCQKLSAEQKKRLKVPEKSKCDNKNKPAPIAPSGFAMQGGKSDEPKPETTGTKLKARAVIVVRSPEAILYYLGELIRAQMDGDLKGEIYTGATHIGKDAGEQPIFKVVRGRIPDAFVSVKYDSQEYSVGSDHRKDSSSHTLSLISQLIGLHKEASEFPQSTQIRVITQ